MALPSSPASRLRTDWLKICTRIEAAAASRGSRAGGVSVRMKQGTMPGSRASAAGKLRFHQRTAQLTGRAITRPRKDSACPVAAGLVGSRSIRSRSWS